MDIIKLFDQSNKIVANFNPSNQSCINATNDLEELYIKYNEILQIVEKNIITCKMKMKIQNRTKSKNLKVTAARVIDNIDDVPNTLVYYVRSMDLYAIRINNVLMYGNIGKVGKKLPNIIPCRNGISCVNSNCTYYHDPLKIPWSKDVMNFHSSSWLYTEDPLSSKNQHMRHIGNDPINEKNKISPMEKQRWAHQSIHDILTTILLHN